MSATRRQFIRNASLGAAALALPIPLFGQAAKPGAAGFSPSQWLRIGADGSTVLVVAHSEMGQGVRTSLAMILAEELEADWKSVVIEQASPGPLFTDTGTGGSDSVTSSWKPLREAGAAAREMLVEAAARRWNVKASECRAETGAVIHSASGRKAAYGELVADAAALPVPKEPRLKGAKDFRLVGTRVPRIDGPGIVSGRAVYGIDTRVPGMLYAAVAVSPVRGGKLAKYEAGKAKSVPGVRDVVPIEGGVAVLADDTFAALSGRDALGVVWDEGENGKITTEELWKRIDRAAASAGRSTRKAGDAGAVLAAAPTRLSATYRTPFQAHATLEPGNTIARVDGGSCEIWSPTQAPGRVQKDVAKLLGIAPDKVTVHVTLIGGGFGRRLGSDYATQAVEVARAAKRPVQLVWSRADDFLQDRVHPAARVDLAAGLDASGRLAAWTHTATTFHLSMFGPFDANEDPDGNPWGGCDNPYDIPNLQVGWNEVESPVHTGAWRAVYYPANVFARECFLDEIAAKAGKDPLAFRLALLGGPSPFTYGKRKIDRAGLSRVLKTAAEKSGWGGAAPRREGRRSGRGLACNIYHGSTLIAQVADVSVGAKGDVRVHRVVTAVDCGQVVNLAGVEGQVESGVIWGLSYALKGELTFAAGRVAEKGFGEYPVLRLDEMPTLETHVLAGASAPLGMGEMPVPCVAPAVANAIAAATGRRVRRLPIRPADLL